MPNNLQPELPQDEYPEGLAAAKDKAVAMLDAMAKAEILARHLTGDRHPGQHPTENLNLSRMGANIYV
jgi:hypothetical protein